eukprot:gene19096-biopygen17468
MQRRRRCQEQEHAQPHNAMFCYAMFCQVLYPGDRATDETLHCDCGKGGSTHKGRVLRHDGAADPGRFLIAAARARRCPRCAAAAAAGGGAAAAAAVPCLTFSL